MTAAIFTAVALGLLGMQSSPVAGLDGSLHHPLLEAKGKPLALLFISHDCPICNAYAPELKRIALAYAKRGVRVELIYSEPNLTLSAARVHAKSYSYGGLSMFLDHRGTLAKATGATITPEAAVYDRSGKLVYLGRIDDRYIALGKQRARVTSHDFREALDLMLSNKPVIHARTPAVGCYIATEST